MVPYGDLYIFVSSSAIVSNAQGLFERSTIIVLGPGNSFGTIDHLQTWIRRTVMSAVREKESTRGKSATSRFHAKVNPSVRCGHLVYRERTHLLVDRHHSDYAAEGSTGHALP